MKWLICLACYYKQILQTICSYDSTGRITMTSIGSGLQLTQYLTSTTSVVTNQPVKYIGVAELAKTACICRVDRGATSRERLSSALRPDKI